MRVGFLEKGKQAVERGRRCRGNRLLLGTQQDVRKGGGSVHHHQKRRVMLPRRDRGLKVSYVLIQRQLQQEGHMDVYRALYTAARTAKMGNVPIGATLRIGVAKIIVVDECTSVLCPIRHNQRDKSSQGESRVESDREVGDAIRRPGEGVVLVAEDPRNAAKLLGPIPDSSDG